MKLFNIYVQIGGASAEADGTEKEKVRVTQLPQAIARGKSILALPHTIPCEWHCNLNVSSSQSTCTRFNVHVDLDGTMRQTVLRYTGDQNGIGGNRMEKAETCWIVVRAYDQDEASNRRWAGAGARIERHVYKSRRYMSFYPFAALSWRHALPRRTVWRFHFQRFSDGNTVW